MSSIGTVYLKVANLQRQLAFYQDVIGLNLLRQDGKTVYLGAGANELLALTENSDGRRYRGVTGLYHFAILVPSRYHLALSLKHLADTQTALQGMSDHYVSEAIYLADPEGNGIEIYRDKPRADWYVNGEMQLTTEAMDVAGVMDELKGRESLWHGLDPETVMGHIHLHVSSIPQAEAFFMRQLGMESMFNIGSAAFLAYEQYHHHVGVNIWGGRSTPPADALGLEKYNLNVPAHLLETILAGFDALNVPIEAQDRRYLITDPAQAQIVLQAV